jgi:hypothetical protein
LIFGHKIVEVKLFQIGGDGTLGYVNHSYNPKNIYHKIGNFFIGVAPIIGVALAFYLLNLLLVPEMANQIADSAKTVNYTGGMGEILAKEVSCITKVDRMLTLNGLRILYEMNKG